MKTATPAINPPQTRPLWNGDDASTGGGWASCAKPGPDCSVSIVTLPDGGREGTSGIKLSAKGHGWMVGHFSWTSRAARSIADISGYGALTFSIRVEARGTNLGPPPKSTTITLTGAPEQMGSGVVIDACKPGFSDGGWHRVVIPLTEFKNVDLTQIQGLTLTVHSDTARDFSIYVDDIQVEMHDAARAGCEHPLPGSDRPLLARYPCSAADAAAYSRQAADRGTSDAIMEGIQTTVRPNFRRLQECYEKALATNAEVSGKVTVKFSVAPDGSVSTASAVCTSLPDEAAVDCIVDVFKSIRFPSSEQEREGLSYALMFRSL